MISFVSKSDDVTDDDRCDFSVWPGVNVQAVNQQTDVPP